MKKKILFVLALCFMLPISLALTACNGIKQPPQEEMHEIYMQAQDALRDYQGSWSLNGTVKATFTQAGQTTITNGTLLETYNSETKEYVDAEIFDEELDSYTVVKTLPNGTFEKWTNYDYNNRIVDGEYVQNSYAQEFLDGLINDLNGTYEEVIAELAEDEAESKEEYSTDGYSYNEISMKLTYKKVSDTEYQYILEQVRDINTPEDEGETGRVKNYTKYIYTFEEGGINSVAMNYEYHSWKFDATTKKQTSYRSNVQEGNRTFVKSFDTTAMGQVDLTGKTAPTAKIQQQLNIYLDGEREYSENVDFGTDIDTIISTEITAKENCSLGSKYLDESLSQAYVAGMKTSSYKTTNVYIVSQPNEGYALVGYKFYDDYYGGEYNLFEQEWTVYEANKTIELDPRYNNIVHSDLVKKNGEITTEKSVALESEQVYMYEFYRNYTSKTCGDVTVYINGEMIRTFENENYWNEDYSVIGYINNKESDLTYCDWELYGFEYDVYLDVDCTQKADKFTKLGEGNVTLYIKAMPPEDYVLVNIEDDFYNVFLAGTTLTYMEYFNRNYADVYDSEDFITFARGTINGVDFAESPYVSEGTNGGYVLNLEGGNIYHIVISPVEK